MTQRGCFQASRVPKIAKKNHHVFEQDLKTLKNKKFDVITMWDVIEHIKDGNKSSSDLASIIRETLAKHPREKSETEEGKKEYTIPEGLRLRTTRDQFERLIELDPYTARNIAEEFKEFGLPIWLRDLVGILKLSFVIMLFGDDLSIVILGSLGIAGLMLAALITHLRIKNPFYKMLHSMSLMLISCVIIIFSFQGL